MHYSPVGAHSFQMRESIMAAHVIANALIQADSVA